MLPKVKEHIENHEIFRIVTIGDSITSAEWVHPNWREILEYVLKSELTDRYFSGDPMGWKIPSWGIRFINAGLDGATTADHVRLLPAHTLFHHPHFAIVILGCNDVLSLEPHETSENLKTLISQLKAEGITVALCNNPYITDATYREKYLPYHAQIETVAHEADCFIDLWRITQEYPLDRMFTFISEGNEEVGMKPGDIDYLHPNALGNAFIAKALLKELFAIDFDPVRYMKDVHNGEMFPTYSYDS